MLLVDAIQIADHITLFLGMHVNDTDRTFKVSPELLARRGVTRRFPHNRQYSAPRTDKMKQKWSYRGPAEHGLLAVLLGPQDLFGKCVYVYSLRRIGVSKTMFWHFWLFLNVKNF